MSLTDLTAAQINEYKEVFSLFDVNNDGHVNTKELGTVMRSLGQNPSEEELAKMVAEIDKDGSGVLEFPEFATMMAIKMKEATSFDKLVEAFQVFDKERSGFVSVAEFRHINELGDDTIPPELLEDMIAYADGDGVGQINYEDFVKKLVGAGKK